MNAELAVLLQDFILLLLLYIYLYFIQYVTFINLTIMCKNFTQKFFQNTIYN